MGRASFSGLTHTLTERGFLDLKPKFHETGIGENGPR